MSHVKNYRAAWRFAEDEPVTCERCGGLAGEIHHITYRSHGGDNEFANLIGLCVACHQWAHTRADRAEYLLKISSRYWFWIPIGLLLVVLYWRLAWGAIGTYLESPVEEKRGWATGAGCMILALAVFLLICILVSIPLLG